MKFVRSLTPKLYEKAIFLKNMYYLVELFCLIYPNSSPEAISLQEYCK